MFSKKTILGRLNLATLIAGPGLWLALSASPVAAQEVCEVVADTPLGTSTGVESLTCGGSANSLRSTSFGIGASIDEQAEQGATTVGTATTVNGSSSATPINYFAVPNGSLGGIAIGAFSGVNGDDSMAVGTGAIVGFNGGPAQNVVVEGGTAIGVRASVQDDAGTAIGFNASVTAANSIAIGAGSVADQADTVSVGMTGGERRIVNVAAGDVTASSTNAINGSQLFVTNQNVTTNTTAITSLQTSDTAQNTAITSIQAVNTTQATQITALQVADAAFDSRIDTLEALAIDFDDDLDRVDDRASAGTAAAVALSGAMFLPGKSFNLTGNVGAYRGAVAGAVQFGALVSDNVAVNAGVAHGFNKGGKTALRAGFTVGW